MKEEEVSEVVKEMISRIMGEVLRLNREMVEMREEMMTVGRRLNELADVVWDNGGYGEGL